eukprot:5606390-Pyramimonas_sp.AAC.1
MDLNDGIGIVCSEGRWQSYDTTVIPSHLATRENIVGGAGQLVRELMEEFGFVVLGVRDRVEDTWFGQDGISSRVDYIFGPVVAQNLINTAGPLMRVMRQHQRIPSRHPRDHIPLHCNLKWSFVEPEQLGRNRLHWNFDTMKNASVRENFLIRANARLQECEPELASAATAGKPDAYFAILNDLVREQA